MTPVELTEAAGVVVALLSSVVMPSYVQRRKDRRRTDTELTLNDANLRDDQREFIAVLQKENREWRQQVEQLRTTTAALYSEIYELRQALADESRARKATETRYLEILESRNPQPVSLLRQPPEPETGE